MDLPCSNLYKIKLYVLFINMIVARKNELIINETKDVNTSIIRSNIYRLELTIRASQRSLARSYRYGWGPILFLLYIHSNMLLHIIENLYLVLSYHKYKYCEEYFLPTNSSPNPTLLAYENIKNAYHSIRRRK